VFSSDLPGVNPTTLNKMILYYHLMTKWSGLGDSTELSRMGLSHVPMDLFCDMKTIWIQINVRKCYFILKMYKEINDR
jgi:hypothetical protein